MCCFGVAKGPIWTPESCSLAPSSSSCSSSREEELFFIGFGRHVGALTGMVESREACFGLPCLLFRCVFWSRAGNVVSSSFGKVSDDTLGIFAIWDGLRHCQYSLNMSAACCLHWLSGRFSAGARLPGVSPEIIPLCRLQSYAAVSQAIFRKRFQFPCDSL